METDDLVPEAARSPTGWAEQVQALQEVEVQEVEAFPKAHLEVEIQEVEVSAVACLALPLAVSHRF